MLAKVKMKRSLRIVKLTPIALGMCEACNAKFQSKQPVESDAEAEITFQFNHHSCEGTQATRREPK
jgi:hypothetical protein